MPAPEDPAPLGPDAARWALLYPAPHDRPRITADHLLQRESNPLFRVRYAHARARALGRNAVRLGFDAVPGDLADVTAADPLVRPSPSIRTPSLRRPPTVRPTGSPGISLPSPMPCSSFSTPCSRSATRNPRPPTGPGWLSPQPPGRCWPAACPCSASAHPTISERAQTCHEPFRTSRRAPPRRRPARGSLFRTAHRSQRPRPQGVGADRRTHHRRRVEVGGSTSRRSPNSSGPPPTSSTRRTSAPGPGPGAPPSGPTPTSSTRGRRSCPGPSCAGCTRKG